MSEKKRVNWRGALVDVLLVLGAAGVAVGAGLIFLPAGLITGGALCIGAAYLMANSPCAGGEE